MTQSKIIKVIHIITGLGDGGAEGVLYRLCSFGNEHHHIVITLGDLGKYGSALISKGITVYCLDMPPGRLTLSGLLRLFRILRQEQPHILQTWLYHSDLIGGLVGRLAGVTRIVWGIRHGNLTPGTVKRSTIWVARICAVLSSYVPSLIICCSEQARAMHVKMGYAKEKIKTIPNGFNLTQLFHDVNLGLNIRANLNIASDKFLIGMVARFDPQKDHANIIEALGILRNRNLNFHCLLVGGGITADNINLRNQIARFKLGNHISLLGKRNDITGIMNSLDLHVLSSLGEAFPNVLAEAMACGTPCVTTDVGDASYIIGDTGWLVPPRAPIRLANAIELAMVARKDPLTWSTRQQAARQRVVDNFSIEKMTSSYAAIWQSLI